MKTRSLILMTFLAAGAFCRAADSTAEAIADAVIKASGGDNWSKVNKIHFTFNVEQDGKQLMSATHEWDVAKGTDTVTWEGKTATVKFNAGQTTPTGFLHHSNFVTRGRPSPR
jgi:hypothetical protein